MTDRNVMRISAAGAYARGLGGQLLHPDPDEEAIARLCKEIQQTWPPEEFVERRSYQEPVSPRRRMFMRKAAGR